MLFDAIFGVFIGVVSAAVWAVITKVANPKKPDDAALKLLDIAVDLLPENERDEAREQWLADLIEFNEPQQRYRHASTLWVAALKQKASALREISVKQANSLCRQFHPDLMLIKFSAFVLTLYAKHLHKGLDKLTRDIEKKLATEIETMSDEVSRYD